MTEENGTWIMCGVEEDDPYCIKSVEELEAYINDIGFLPLFKNEIPGFSVEERTVAMYWWSGNRERDPWEWRAIIAERGNIAYGKFFDKKAGFISKEWMPYFSNWRRDGYDFDARWDDEKAQLRQKKIMDLFMAEEGCCLYSNDVKKKAGFGNGGEKNFEGVITQLQMETYLCVRAFRQRLNKQGVGYGWPVAVYTMPENLWGGSYIADGYKEEPSESHDKIYGHIRDVYPIATDKMIKKVIG